jgi:thymidylate synthase ThyX
VGRLGLRTARRSPDEINKCLSQLTYHTDRCARPKIVNPRDSGVANAAFTNRQGIVNPVSMAAAQGIRYLEFANNTKDIESVLAIYKELFNQITGSGELDRAKDPEHPVIAYRAIAAALQKEHSERMMREGAGEEQAKKLSEKAAIEDARFVLPNACETKLIVTMNARSLNNFFRHRLCNRAQWEIRAMAEEMLKEVLKVAPALFKAAGPPCLKGACPEGKMTCGKIGEVREHFKMIKESC